MAFGWFRSREKPGGLEAWRRAWHQAADAPTEAAIGGLRRDLDALGLPDDDLEIEREMLEGLAAAVAFAHQLADGLPVVDTGHRIVGADACHFIATASRPDDPAQPGGRLIFTNRRAIFAGGGAAFSLAWHAVGEVFIADRDLLLVRRAGNGLDRFRCNSYEDALRGRLLGERLATQARPSPRV